MGFLQDIHAYIRRLHAYAHDMHKYIGNMGQGKRFRLLEVKPLIYERERGGRGRYKRNQNKYVGKGVEYAIPERTQLEGTNKWV